MRRREPPPREPRRLGGAIPQVLGDLGLAGAAQALRVAEVWPQVLGAEAAAHAEPVGLRGRSLEVEADSSAWAQHVQLRQGEILAALTRLLGEAAPDALRVRVG